MHAKQNIPRSYPAELHKRSWPSMAHFYMQMISEILNNLTLQQHINTTLISLIPKTKTPINSLTIAYLLLINTDIKIFSKPFAIRLEFVLPFLVHPDLTDFKRSIPLKLFNFKNLCNMTMTTYQKPQPQFHL